ncbi:hypothetical protein [uncultured Deefgea sp.]|uniref:hypothetical protein n=1 Tax=uncultured Deefgea sp. TaxID=1304914 RepID=UPI00261CE05D|nr:hypothetical protein [uncultured Deefgea sp.]
MTTPSLLHYFEAPDHYLGSFGWLCGYSADCNFLDQAAERFTRQTSAQRAHQGQISLAVMLDPAHSAIALTDAPGVAHLIFKSGQKKPFALLHAKVAILGFRHEKEPNRWLIRLIISTGNWTVQTIAESLDLVACIECSSDELQQKPTGLEQNCTDIIAAWEMLEWLSGYFDTRILHAKSNHQSVSLTEQSIQWLSGWLNAIAAYSNSDSTPRYFDNRKQSLLTQLAPLIKQHATSVKRNYLCMGSGFFEGANGHGQLPSVLSKITTTLQNVGLLTACPEVDVFVNPNACQAVADGLSAMQAAGYRIRAAAQNTEIFGSVVPRSLHAKFIFSANLRAGSARCSSAWVYLGSGNLTGPGFANPMSTAGGNLEAGMLLSSERLYWSAEGDVSAAQIITNRLPVQWDTEISAFGQLLAGEAMPEHNDGPLAAPLAWLNWKMTEEGNSLCAPEQTEVQITLLDANGEACPLSHPGVWHWPSQAPRMVTIQWSVANQRHSTVIPVMDESGRIAGTPIPELELAEVWWQLTNFPQSAVDEDKLLDELEDNSGGSGATTNTNATNYPIRQMMALIEQIAAKQVDLHPLDWLAWCTRLEQSLLQVAKDPVIRVFRAMNLNPLSPLREAAFLPDFAEQASSAEGANYRALLSRIEASWDVANLCPIGEQP